MFIIKFFSDVTFIYILLAVKIFIRNNNKFFMGFGGNLRYTEKIDFSQRFFTF